MFCIDVMLLIMKKKLYNRSIKIRCAEYLCVWFFYNIKSMSLPIKMIDGAKISATSNKAVIVCSDVPR